MLGRHVQYAFLYLKFHLAQVWLDMYSLHKVVPLYIHVQCASQNLQWVTQM